MKSIISADMKELNRMVVYNYVHKKSGQTVSLTEISKMTNISGPTVLKTINFMKRNKLLIPHGTAESSELGRKPSMFKFNPHAAHAIGAAYNGQVLELSLINLNFEAVKEEKIMLVTDVPSLISKILPSRVKQFVGSYKSANILGICISLPASVDPVNKKISCLSFSTQRSLQQKEDLSDECEILEKSLKVPVFLENDVNLAAVAEFYNGNLQSKDDLVFIMLGRGFGAGIILDGKLRYGRHFTCGEVGYMVFDTAFMTNSEKPGYMEWQLYRHVADRFGIDLLQSDLPSYPFDMMDHIAEQLALVIANISNVLDISKFFIGGFVYDKLGFTLVDMVNKKLKNLTLHSISLSAYRIEGACSKGAATFAVYKQLGTLLSDENDKRKEMITN